MISLVVNGSSLAMAGLPPEGMDFAQMQTAYEQCRRQFATSGVSEIVADLTGIAPANHSVITFLVGCGELAARRGITIKLAGITDETLRGELTELGFADHGGYTPKSFRPAEPQSVFVTTGEAVYQFGAATRKLVGFIGEIVNAVLYLLRHPRKLDLGETLFYMDKSGADGTPIVMLVCFLMGMILAFQGISQMMRFGLQVYIADLVGLAIIRELGPLMVAMICIGRAGSAYAAELGTMKVAEEIDAMETMGLRPARFLVVPKIVALLLTVPMLVMVGNLCGIIGGIMVTLAMSDITYPEYLQRTLEVLVPWNLGESLVKAFVFAFIIAGVGCFRGFESERDAKGVGSATTSAVVSGIFLVVLADFFVTFFYPQILHAFGITY